jgi:hypothetical protein
MIIMSPDARDPGTGIEDAGAAAAPDAAGADDGGDDADEFVEGDDGE